MVSPEGNGDIENQLLQAEPTMDETGIMTTRQEDLVFVNRLRKKSQRGLCHCLYRYAVWAGTGEDVEGGVVARSVNNERRLCCCMSSCSFDSFYSSPSLQASPLASLLRP